MYRSRVGVFILTTALAALVVLLIGTAGCTRSGGGQTGSQATTPGGGKAAPEANVAIPNLDGSTTSLGQYKGKVVLVNFWATWCEPCQQEIPWLIQMNQQYGPKGLVILGVAMDDDGKKVVEPYVKNHKFDVNGMPETMDYPILLGNDDIGDKFGGQEGLPTSYLYSRDGRKTKTIIGSMLMNKDGLTKAINSLLNTPPPGA